MNVKPPDWLKCPRCAWYEAGFCHLQPMAVQVARDWWCKEWTRPENVRFALPEVFLEDQQNPPGEPK